MIFSKLKKQDEQEHQENGDTGCMTILRDRTLSNRNLLKSYNSLL